MPPPGQIGLKFKLRVLNFFKEYFVLLRFSRACNDARSCVLTAKKQTLSKEKN